MSTLIDYTKLSSKYKPKIIKVLLVAESPPYNEKKYFYKVPDKTIYKKEIIKDSSLPSTIFNHYFNKRPSDPNEYENFLKALKSMGVFLIDILEKPTQIRNNPKNIQNITSTNTIETLKKRIQNLNPEKVIFLLPRNTYRDFLLKHFPSASFVNWIYFRMDIHESKDIRNYNLNTMLITPKGKCQKCKNKFGHYDTVQSTNLECKQCGNKVKYCHNCRNNVCVNCGGEFLDSWDKVPQVHY